MQFTRNALVSLLDLWYDFNVTPLEDWRTKHAHIKTELKKVNDKVRVFEDIMHDPKHPSIHIPSNAYTEYYRNKTHRSTLYADLTSLDEDEKNRIWYHTVRNQLVS